jgi:hypothetical protein
MNDAIRPRQGHGFEALLPFIVVDPDRGNGMGASLDRTLAVRSKRQLRRIADQLSTTSAISPGSIISQRGVDRFKDTRQVRLDFVVAPDQPHGRIGGSQLVDRSAANPARPDLRRPRGLIADLAQ